METITLDKSECDRLTGKLATMEAELRQARKQLEAPRKVGWWRRLWGMESKAVVVVLVVACSLAPAVSHALTLKQKALVGLKGVDVLVEDIDPQAERLGLTRAVCISGSWLKNSLRLVLSSQSPTMRI